MLQSRIHPLKPEFTFAGFTFPRYVATLPTGTMKARVSQRKPPMTGDYYHAPTPNNRAGIGFYLSDSDGCPFSLRHQWCDEVHGAYIDHRGWFADDYQDTKYRGIVFRLPHGRGFLAGYSMGENMLSSVDFYVYRDAVDAAYAADALAEQAADREREYVDQTEGA
jgi:hypothetical protein